MHSRLHLCFNPLIEFIITMQTVAREHSLQETIQNHQVLIDPDYMDWAGQMRSKLSRYLQQELTYFIGDDHFHCQFDFVFIQLFKEHPDASVEKFITLFQQLTETEILATMVESVFRDRLKGLLGENIEWDYVKQSPDAMLTHMRQWPSETEEIKDKLIECLEHPKETKRRYESMIEQIYENIYKPFAERIHMKCKAGIKKYELLFSEDLERNFGSVVKLDPSAIDRTTNVHISFMGQVTMNYERDDRAGYRDWIILGINNDRHFLEDVEREIIEKFLKVLSDKRRLEIVDLLLTKAWYGHELAHELNLTPAAISYHMNFLIEIDLVKLTRSDNRLYYSLDKEKVRSLFDQAKKSILKE